MAAAAATATIPSTFPRFWKFPLELRNQIWKEALPVEISASLYFWKPECWHPRVLTESDPGYSDEVDEQFSSVDLNRKFEFRHDLLDKSQFKTPLLFVNHEARNIVFTWARNCGMIIYNESIVSSTVLAVPFNPVHDILYVPVRQWDKFFIEPYCRSHEEDMINLSHGTINETKRLAVRWKLLEIDINALIALYEYFDIEVLYIIDEVSGRALWQTREGDLQSRWECRETKPAFIWNDEKKTFEMMKEGEVIKHNFEDGDYDDGWLTENGFLLLYVSERFRRENIRGHGKIREIRTVSAYKI